MPSRLALFLLATLVTGCFVDRSGIGPAADGSVDSSFDGSDGGSVCPEGTVDVDGDPANGCECTLAEPAVEVCDDEDDDCDGNVDENVTDVCGTPGTCGEGVQTCTSGEWGDCVLNMTPGEEVCDGVADEDCDTRVDEGCTCVAGALQDCGTDVGVCEMGKQLCLSDNTWSTECTDEVVGSDEVCNGMDDDCDGTIDDFDQVCGTSVGICTMGVEHCSGGSFSVCTGVAPGTEVCDAARLDEDCDGDANEGCACDAGDTASCTINGCEGTMTCDETGTYSACAPDSVGLETCNGVDDDCDGTIDDGAADCAGRTGCTFVRRGASVYLICDANGRDFDGAQAYCGTVGYNLTTINGSGENEFLNTEAAAHGGNTRFWIGLSDVDDDGSFENNEWITGNSSYRQWGSNQPNGDNGDCVALRTDRSGTWWDRACDHTLLAASICEAR